MLLHKRQLSLFLHHKDKEARHTPSHVHCSAARCVMTLEEGSQNIYFFVYFDVKALFFIATVREELRRFAPEARKEAGFQLAFVQRGLMPTDFKPLLSVGPGAYELRIRVKGAWRVIYIAKYSSAVYVLHAFGKKSQKTPREAIKLARLRYRLIGE